MLPLDLHVLSLSLAFILSQDQTLPCNFVFVCISVLGCISFNSFIDGSILPCKISFLYYYLNFFKERFLALFPYTPIARGFFHLESGCKSSRIMLTLQIFLQVFYAIKHINSQKARNQLLKFEIKSRESTAKSLLNRN